MSRLSNARRRAAGFTLIEIMIVVLIVAVLAAIAYPSYQEQVRKGRRADAMAQMLTLTQAYERFYTSNNTYVGFAASLGSGSTQLQSPTQGAPFYLMTTAETATTFTITATPQALGGQTNDRCGTLTINQAGLRTESGPAAISECWP